MLCMHNFSSSLGCLFNVTFLCSLTLDVTTTDLRARTETAQPDGTETPPETEGCTAVQRRGAGDMEVVDMVAGTEMGTIIAMNTGRMLIMIGARGTTSEAPGKGESQTGREGQSISCRKPVGENMKPTRYL